MKYILVGLLIIAFFCLMFKILLKLTRMKYISDVSGESRSNYIIYFSGVEAPRLEENIRLKEVVVIKKNAENRYHVLSTINDVKLKELLISEYDLLPSNIVINTVRLGV